MCHFSIIIMDWWLSFKVSLFSLISLQREILLFFIIALTSCWQFTHWAYFSLEYPRCHFKSLIISYQQPLWTTVCWLAWHQLSCNRAHVPSLPSTPINPNQRWPGSKQKWMIYPTLIRSLSVFLVLFKFIIQAVSDNLSIKPKGVTTCD